MNNTIDVKGSHMRPVIIVLDRKYENTSKSGFRKLLVGSASEKPTGLNATHPQPQD